MRIGVQSDSRMPTVEIPSSIEQRPSDRAVAFPRSAVQLPTLHAIHDDPSAVDVQIGTAFPDDVIRAHALSLILPGSNDSGSEAIVSFGNLQLTQRSEHDCSQGVPALRFDG